MIVLYHEAKRRPGGRPWPPTPRPGRAAAPTIYDISSSAILYHDVQCHTIPYYNDYFSTAEAVRYVIILSLARAAARRRAGGGGRPLGGAGNFPEIPSLRHFRIPNDFDISAKFPMDMGTAPGWTRNLPFAAREYVSLTTNQLRIRKLRVRRL